MTYIEIALTDLSEIATRELAKEYQPKGLEENKKIAKLGGNVSKAAKDNFEENSNKLIISNKNNLNYQYIEDKSEIVN